MSENRRVHFIPPRPVQREKRVGYIVESVRTAWSS